MTIQPLKKASQPFKTAHYQSLALAVLFTALDEVVHLAYSGIAQDTENPAEQKRKNRHSVLINSLFSFNAQSPDTIYPDLTLFNSGYKKLLKIISLTIENQEKQCLDYFLGLNKLAKRLLSKKALQQQLQKQLQNVDTSSGETSDWTYTQLNRTRCVNVS